MLWEEWKTQERDTSSNRSFSSLCAREAKSEKEGQATEVRLRREDKQRKKGGTNGKQ